MSYTLTYTHKGWFGLCPVYLARLSSPAPVVEPRHWSLAWLMDLTELLFACAFMLRMVADPHYEPQWPLQITGKLQPPKVEVVEDDEWTEFH